MGSWWVTWFRFWFVTIKLVHLFWSSLQFASCWVYRWFDCRQFNSFSAWVEWYNDWFSQIFLESLQFLRSHLGLHRFLSFNIILILLQRVTFLVILNFRQLIMLNNIHQLSNPPKILYYLLAITNKFTFPYYLFYNYGKCTFCCCFVCETTYMLWCLCLLPNTVLYYIWLG